MVGRIIIVQQKKRTLRVVLVWACLFAAISTHAQLSITNAPPYNTSSYLINDVFLGGQITAFNFEYNNVANGQVTQQVGYFTGGDNIFGIDSGIVMGTGSVFSIPNNGFASTSFSGPGDGDVLAVAQSVGWGNPPSAMRDKAVLEFDFVAPQDDSVVFEYCFGSEEWPVYPCSPFNDAFGFFISGPGLNGPYSNNAVNVSIVPGTTSLPVAITSIHAGGNGNGCQSPSFAQYYHNGPTSQPFTFADLNLNNTYGAWTSVFQTKTVHVNACDTYHVKLAICDGSDWIYDSAVFLKAKSFQFLGITVNPQPTYNPFGYDTALYEGCGNLRLAFQRIDTAYPPYDLHFQLTGTATMGVDYDVVPNCTLVNGIYDCTITFQQDSTTAALNIPIFYDNLNEIYETLLLVVKDSLVNLCGDDDTLRLTIVDQPDLQVTTFGNTTLDCHDPPADIGLSVLGGLPPFTYLWSNGVTDSTQSVLPDATTIYTVEVHDACGQQVEVGAVSVARFNVPWTVTQFGSGQTINCTSDPAVMGVEVQFNDGLWHGDIHYHWGTGDTTASVAITAQQDTTVLVTISRGCSGDSVVKAFELFVHNDPVQLVTEDTKVEDIACPGDAIQISVQATGGYPPYTYHWQDGSPDSTTIVAPLVTDTVYVTVTDVCALVEYTDYVIVPVPTAAPLTIRGIKNDTLPCKNSLARFGPAVPGGGFGWGYELSWTDFQTQEAYMEQYVQEDTAFTIRLTDGCHVDTLSERYVAHILPHNDLSLRVTPDTVVCLGDAITLKAKADHGGGEYEYFWNNALTASGPYLKVKPVTDKTYAVRVNDRCDTARTDTIRVSIFDIRAAFDYRYTADYEVDLLDASTSTDSIVRYLWQVPAAALNAAEAMPHLVLPDGQTYEVALEVWNDHGCSSTVHKWIAPDYHLYIPNTFTPNKDGVNERWHIESTGIREMRLEIYDRWGNCIFQTNDKDFDWDATHEGQSLPMGVYAWRIDLVTDQSEYAHREGIVVVLYDAQPDN